MPKGLDGCIRLASATARSSPTVLDDAPPHLPKIFASHAAVFRVRHECTSWWVAATESTSAIDGGTKPVRHHQGTSRSRRARGTFENMKTHATSTAKATVLKNSPKGRFRRALGSLAVTADR